MGKIKKSISKLKKISKIVIIVSLIIILSSPFIGILLKYCNYSNSKCSLKYLDNLKEV